MPYTTGQIILPICNIALLFPAVKQILILGRLSQNFSFGTGSGSKSSVIIRFAALFFLSEPAGFKNFPVQEFFC
jgi:hypothetical protein